MFCSDTDNVEGRTAFDGVVMGLMAGIGITEILIEIWAMVPLPGSLLLLRAIMLSTGG